MLGKALMALIAFSGVFAILFYGGKAVWNGPNALFVIKTVGAVLAAAITLFLLTLV